MSTWAQRIARARELTTIYPSAADVLTFYAALAELQWGVYTQAKTRGAGGAGGFRERLDLSFLVPQFSAFLARIAEPAPPALAATARQMRAYGEVRWAGLLQVAWQPTPARSSNSGEGISQSEDASGLRARETFLARAFVQPFAEYIAERIPAVAVRSHTPTCPKCDSEPAVGVLRPEGQSARRSLICSFCSTEWSFPRGVCAGCGEDRAEQIAIFVAEQFDHVRVEACDTCKTYLKIVDLSRNGLAIPVVDELATLPLTFWAEEHGYTKLQPNLLAA